MFDPNADNKPLINNISPLPISLAGADGGYVWDVDGKKYLDWYNDNGVVSLGYNDPGVREAVERAASTGLFPHVPQMFPHALRDRVAQKMADACRLDRVCFAPGGGDAVETAIKAARLYHHQNSGIKRKQYIVTLPEQYHGRTGYAMAANQSAVYHKDGFGPMPQRFAKYDPERKLMLFQPEDGGGAVNAGPEDGIWEDVAAILYAPVLGNNVIRRYSDDVHNGFARIRQLWDVAIIHDDVQAGCGRGGAYASWLTGATKPNMVCLGKGVAAGWPLAATVMDEKYGTAFTPGTHFYTFGGSSVASLAAAEVVLDWLANNGDAPDSLGARLSASLASVPGIVETWHVGAMVAAMPDYERGYTAKDVFDACRDEGLLLINFRPTNELKIMPRLNATRDEVAHGVSMFKRAMARVRGAV